ncbi:hypothetical protein KAI37_00844 [Paenibacillus sp. S25]|nr:hypothetical protein KAI37_00844 [Paenibacillus sp. S25]
MKKVKIKTNLLIKTSIRLSKRTENRVDVDKYAHVASLEEIKENEFNLNIPRYVDTFEEEQVIDLAEVNKLLEQDKQEIAELEAKINEQLKILGIHV